VTVKIMLRERESVQEAVRRFRKLVDRSGLKRVARGQEGGQFRGTRGPGQWLRNGARNGTQRA
jgi:hypothetical protein